MAPDICLIFTYYKVVIVTFIHIMFMLSSFLDSHLCVIVFVFHFVLFKINNFLYMRLSLNYNFLTERQTELWMQRIPGLKVCSPKRKPLNL